MAQERTALLLLLLIVTPSALPSEATPAIRPIDIEASTSEQIAGAEWAMSRYETAGIELPPLTIVFHDDYAACGMRQGLLRAVHHGQDVAFTIHSCERDPAARRNLLHELAHVWDQTHAIDPATKSAFLAARGLTVWDGDDVTWPHRGEEQAAEIMAWGLMERFAPIPTRVGEVGPQDSGSLAAAFTTLIGRAPLFAAP